MNTNNEDLDKCCGLSTDFMSKLTDFFLIIIGEKASTKVPLRKMNWLGKNAMLTCLYGPMYLHLDDYPPYSDKKSDVFETHINRLNQKWNNSEIDYDQYRCSDCSKLLCLEIEEKNVSGEII